MMFPYYLLPKADEGQAPDEERKRAYDPLSSIRVRQPKAKRRNPTVPLVVYTAFGVREAEQLRKRLENTPRPVDMGPQSQYNPSDPDSSTQAPSSIPASENRQYSRRNRDISNALAGSDKPKDIAANPSQASIEPSISGFPRDIEWEPDISSQDLEPSWSSEFKLHQLRLEYNDELVREVATSLLHERLIDFYLDNPKAYLKNFPQYSWDEESAQLAEEFLLKYLEDYQPSLLHEIMQNRIEDLTNNEREIVIAIDLKTGETVFIRYGDEDSVTLQKELRKLVEEREIMLLHNHPNNSPASLADLDAADWLDTEYMIVVNQDGTQHHYERVGGEMMPLAPVHNPAYVAEADPVETLAADLAFWIQTLSEIGNPPEMVMRQGEATAVIEVSGSFRGYADQWYADARQADPETFMNYNFTDEPQEFRVVGRSPLNQSLVLVAVRYPGVVNFKDL